MGQVFSEADMYAPVKHHLEAMGFTVTAEVKGLDVTAIKGDELVVLELKKVFNIKLLYQALDRQKITDMVYMVIPRPKKARSAQFTNAVHIAKSLKLGLLTVAMDSGLKTVEAVVHPEAGTKKIDGRRKRSILIEISGRSIDGNIGGSRGGMKLTAYREKALKIACVLYDNGPMKAAEMISKYGCDANARNIVYTNHYKWFCREKPGVYGLTRAGEEVIEEGGAFSEIIAFYRKKTIE